MQSSVFEALLHKGVIVRGGHALGFPTSLRVTVGSKEENEKFIRALEEVLADAMKIAIIGVGLIGGSLALCFKGKPNLHVVGYSPNPPRWKNI